MKFNHVKTSDFFTCHINYKLKFFSHSRKNQGELILQIQSYLFLRSDIENVKFVGYFRILARTMSNDLLLFLALH